jgi:hypothetical protein
MLSEWMNALRVRIKTLFRRRQLDRNLDDKLQFHLAMREQKLTEIGVPEEQARYAARREFGNTTEAKEMNRKMWTFPFLETLWQDIRYSLRQLCRNPGFSAAAIFIIGLGIAGTCVVFSFAEAAVFRALPYSNPSRLVSVTMTDLRASEEGGLVSVPVFLNWREHGNKVGQFASSRWAMKTIVGAEEPFLLFVYTVSEGTFLTSPLGVTTGR